MKRTIMIAAMAALLCPTLLHAQQPEEGVARHAVKLNILSPLFNTPAISYEYRLANRSAVELDVAGTLLKRYGETLTPYAVTAQAQYRFYLNDQRRRGVMPFLGIGVNYTHAWEHFDVFDHNEGWDIYTERYTLRDNVVRPTLMFGIKVNIPFGLVVESTVGLHLGAGIDYHSPARAFYPANYFSTLIGTRIGWAF